MFYYLSKILSYFLSPLFWIFLLMLLSFFSKQRRKGRILLLFAIILLYFFSNGFIVHEVMRAWEIDVVNNNQLKPVYSTGIVLGGDITTFDKTNDRIIFRQNSDRLLQAMVLYKEKRIKKILISAGPGHYLRPNEKEADYCADFLLQAGIPAGDIMVDSESVNTNENAIFSANILNATDLEPPYLLITSAYHMRRSAKCFEKRGLEVEVYPVGKISGPRRFDFEHLFIPHIQSFRYWQLIIHECTGYIVYRIMGYLG